MDKHAQPSRGGKVLAADNGISIISPGLRFSYRAVKDLVVSIGELNVTQEGTMVVAYFFKIFLNPE
jgi:hypothetical protein